MPAPSSTRLTAICDGILEAGWLVAIVVAPLYVNPFTSYNFEPPRALLITAVGLVMLLAWSWKGLEVLAAQSGKRGHSATESTTWGRLLREPVVVFVALMVLSVGVATAFSIAPHVSLMGAYARGEGVYLIGTYFVVFASVGALLRTRAQFERIVSTVLVVSLVVALYGIVQHEGLDPMRWTSAVGERVQSTVGNTIFMGAFLMLMIPLSGYRVLTHLRAVREEGVAGRTMGWIAVGVFAGCLIGWYVALWVGAVCTVVVLGVAPPLAKRVGQPVGRILPLLFYAALAAMQVVALVFTQSRGPLLGLLAGLFVFALLYSLRHGHRRTGWLVVGSAVGGLVVLILLNVPGTPLAFMKKVPYLERLSQVQSTSPTVQVRLLIWEATADLATESPDRFLLGYGPETMREAIAPFYPEGLDQLERREVLPDRAHNELFNLLVARGLVGVVLYLGFFLLILYDGLRHLGLVASARSRAGFWGATVSGTLGTALVVGLADHSMRLVGVGAALGLLGGLTLYLVGQLLGIKAPKEGAERARTVPVADLALVSLLAAMVAYFVETQFGISVVTTELFFWTFAAVITLAMPHWLEKEAATWSDVAGAGVGWAVGLAVGLLAFLFLGPSAEGRGAPLFMLLGLCALGGGAVIVLPETTPRNEDGTGILARFALTAGAVGGAYALVLLMVQGGGDGTPFVLVASVYVAVLVVLVGLGWRLHTPPVRAALTALRGIWRLAPLGVLAVVVWLLVVASLDPMRAEVHASLSQQEAQQERYDRAIEHLQRALALSPRQDYYHWRLAQQLAAQARRMPTDATRDAAFREAIAALDALEALNPNNPEGLHERARLYLRWARATEDPVQRTERFRTADALYRQAVERIANKSVLWQEWGDVGRGLDDTEAAGRRYTTALQLDRTDAHSYAQLGEILRKDGDLERAAEAFERALRYGRPTANLYLLLGTVRQRLGQRDEAIQAYASALDQDSTEVGAHEALTRLYTQEGQCDDALRHAARLRELQPNNFFYRVLAQQTEQRCGQPAAADSTSGP